MAKMITEDGMIHEFLCMRLSHDPPLSMCEQQCKNCFEFDAKMEEQCKEALEQFGIKRIKH